MSVTREQIVAELWNETINRELLSAQQRARAEAGTGGDGEETCRVASHAVLAESEAGHRAQNQLLVKGPVPAQEAAALVHLVKRASLARAKGDDTVKLYLPKEAEAANVSKATMTRALNKLRAAEGETLPFTVNDSWRGGKQRVTIAVPAAIGDEDWSERRAYLTLSMARLAEERKKQGGSEAAVRARWGCPDHPEGAVVETTTKHYRCAEEDCGRSYAPPPTVRRHPGANDPIQVESGGPSDVVEMFGASFASAAGVHPHHVATVTSIEEPHQVATGADPIQVESGRSRPVSFVSRDDQSALGKPRTIYYGPAEWFAEDRPPVDIDTLGTCPKCGEYTVFETRSGVTTCTSCSATLHLEELAPKPPPPEPKPIVTAPRSHAAYWSRPDWRERVRVAGREKGRTDRPPTTAPGKEESEDERR